MGGFCNCGCGGDDCLCQQCGRVVCGRKADSLPVPRQGHAHKGNVCKACQARYGGPVALQVAGLLCNRGQVWPDSADTGVVINDPDQPQTKLRDAMRAMVKSPGWVLDHKWVADGGPRNESWEWRYTAGERMVVVTYAHCRGKEILDYEIL